LALDPRAPAHPRTVPARPSGRSAQRARARAVVLAFADHYSTIVADATPQASAR